MRGEDRKEDVSDSTCEIERGRWTEGRRRRVQRSFASTALEHNNVDWPERHIETETQTRLVTNFIHRRLTRRRRRDLTLLPCRNNEVKEMSTTMASNTLHQSFTNSTMPCPKQFHTISMVKMIVNESSNLSNISSRDWRVS